VTFSHFIRSHIEGVPTLVVGEPPGRYAVTSVG